VERVMAKELNIHEAQDIIRDDLKQFDKTVSGLRNKEGVTVVKKSGSQNKPSQKDKDVSDNSKETRASQSKNNKKGTSSR
jgi:hypothetical protein